MARQFLTMRYHYKATDREKRLLKLLCRISKNIYNSALYELRQQYFKNKTICTYFELNSIVKNNSNFHILNTYQSICIIRCAHDNMSKYIKCHNEDGTLKLSSYKFNDNNDVSSLPKYRKKKSLMPLITDQIRPVWYKGCKCIKLPLSNLARTSKIFNKVFEDELIDTFIKESELKECFNIYFKIPKELYNSHIRQFRIIPNNCGTDYIVEFTYEVESFPKAKSDISKSMAIDLGIPNLATCVTTDNESFIIDGKYLKSMNQFYNKQKAHFQSLLPKDRKYSKRLAKLDERRSKQVEDYLNKAVSTLMTKIKELNVDEVIIGWNKSIKTGGVKNAKLKGKKKKKVNQTFVSIPLSRFKDKLIFKCKQHEIKVITISESYTSKAIFYDNDKIEKSNYSGERIKRGLYKRYYSNVLINADVNGALNIYKKYILKCNSTNNKIDYLMSRGLTIPSRILVNL